MSAYTSSKSVVAPSRQTNIPTIKASRSGFIALFAQSAAAAAPAKEARLSAVIEEQRLEIESLMRQVARLTEVNQILVAAAEENKPSVIAPSTPPLTPQSSFASLASPVRPRVINKMNIHVSTKGESIKFTKTHKVRPALPMVSPSTSRLGPKPVVACLALSASTSTLAPRVRANSNAPRSPIMPKPSTLRARSAPVTTRATIRVRPQSTII